MSKLARIYCVTTGNYKVSSGAYTSLDDALLIAQQALQDDLGVSIRPYNLHPSEVECPVDKNVEAVVQKTLLEISEQDENSDITRSTTEIMLTKLGELGRADVQTLVMHLYGEDNDLHTRSATIGRMLARAEKAGDVLVEVDDEGHRTYRTSDVPQSKSESLLMVLSRKPSLIDGRIAQFIYGSDSRGAVEKARALASMAFSNGSITRSGVRGALVYSVA